MRNESSGELLSESLSRRELLCKVRRVQRGQHFREFVAVSQITVVPKAYAVRRINIERLRFGRSRTASCWVTDVPDANVSSKTLHMPVAKYITYQAITFSLTQAVLAPGKNTSSVLTTMLHDSQRII